VTTTLFLLAAFLAPGAWLVVTIPSLEKAQLCFVLVTLFCAALVCLRLLPLRRPTSRALLVAGLAIGAFLLALVTNAFPVQQFLYDLYGEMPGALWLCYPVVFLLAASIGLGSWVRPALRVVTLVGLLLIVVALYQRFMTPWVTVFGSSAYNISAFIPIPVLALWLATVEDARGRRIAWRVAALLSALAIARISYGFLGIFAVIGLVLLIAALRPQLFGLPQGRLQRVTRLGGRVILALLMVALVIALLPQTSGLLVKRADLVNLGSENIRSRIEFSYAAEALVAKRPLTGAGPAGFRFNVYRYLSPWIYGNTGTIGTEPLAYSPPSPHSLPWEVTTRLGLIGALALLAAGWFWFKDVRGKKGSGPRQMAAAGPSPAPKHEADDDATADAADAADAADTPVPGGLTSLRAACAIAALAWLLSLFVTPMHFASGLLGAALAGLACARPAATGMEALSLSSAGKTVARVIGCAALVLVAILFARQQLALASTETPVATASDDLARLERVARTAPGAPIIEQHILAYRLMFATTPQALNAQLEAVRTAPGYITGFTLNATQFAQVALGQMATLHMTDTTAVKRLLDQAAKNGPVTPALLGEQLHLALVSKDAAATTRAKAAVTRPQFNGQSAEELYPPISDYLKGVLTN